MGQTQAMVESSAGQPHVELAPRPLTEAERMLTKAPSTGRTHATEAPSAGQPHATLAPRAQVAVSPTKALGMEQTHATTASRPLMEAERQPTEALGMAQTHAAVVLRPLTEPER